MKKKKRSMAYMYIDKYVRWKHKNITYRLTDFNFQTSKTVRTHALSFVL